MPWNALQIHSRILIVKIVEKVGSDSSIDLDVKFKFYYTGCIKKADNFETALNLA